MGLFLLLVAVVLLAIVLFSGELYLIMSLNVHWLPKHGFYYFPDMAVAYVAKSGNTWANSPSTLHLGGVIYEQWTMLVVACPSKSSCRICLKTRIMRNEFMQAWCFNLLPFICYTISYIIDYWMATSLLWLLSRAMLSKPLYGWCSQPIILCPIWG